MFDFGYLDFFFVISQKKVTGIFHLEGPARVVYYWHNFLIDGRIEWHIYMGPLLLLRIIFGIYPLIEPPLETYI